MRQYDSVFGGMAIEEVVIGGVTPLELFFYLTEHFLTQGFSNFCNHRWVLLAELIKSLSKDVFNDIKNTDPV